TNKANLLIDIARGYLYDFNDHDAMQAYSEKNLVISQKLNYKKGIAYSYNFLGIARWGKGDLEKALIYFKNALSLMRETNDMRGASSCYSNMGLVYNDQGQYTLAETYTQKAYNTKEELKDLRGMAICQNNLGNIYQNQTNFTKAISAHLNALKIREEMKDTTGISQCYINIALVFEAQGKLDDARKNYETALKITTNTGEVLGKAISLNGLGNICFTEKKYTEALDYYNKALVLRRNNDDKLGQAECLNGIGNIYREQKKHKEAIKSILEGLKLQEEVGGKKASALSYVNLGKISEQIKNYTDAIYYSKKALDIATAINSRDVMRDAYENLASIYEKQNDNENALKYLNLFYAEKDSLLNKDNFKQIYEINTRYQTEKKQKEIELLTKDQIINEKTLKQQKIVRIALIVGLGLVVIVLFSFYARYRFKQKANLLLEQQKKQIQEQNILITDSIDYARTIQEAILPTPSRVKTFFQNSFILYKPKSIVSGDFYWAGEKGNKRICMAADCTGHGVPGAFMSLLGFNMLDNIIEKGQTQPGEILNLLNTEMVSAMTQEQLNTSSVKHGMDAAIISIDYTTMQLEFAGAHNSMYYIRNGHLHEIKADKHSIGSMGRGGEEIIFHTNTICIEKGDVIYLFSDGFPDQIGGPNRKKFYYPPFKELLVKIHQLDMEEQRNILDKTITDWRGERDQTDDILVMGIKID
ncbi:MAG TPA: tetratricopeptide repeat protein, partial [Bacteroidia bacterium]|nr:tetratricopeptide repeat protein [Bacteroidia bacterium]